MRQNLHHAAKQNLSKYPWAQNIVAVGLLKMIKGRWACLPLHHRFYHLKKYIEKTPSRRHIVKGRNHFAFSDVRRLIAEAALDDNFSILCPVPRKSKVNSLVTALLRMAA